MTVPVRPATHADVQGIQTVAREAWHAAHEPVVGEAAVERFLDEYYDPETFRSAVDDEGTILVVAGESVNGLDPETPRNSVDAAARDGTDVVGFALASPTDPGRTFGLGRIYVAPDRWGEGIGRRLLGDVEAAVRDRGGERVTLGVMAENDRAVAFYEAARYAKTDEFYDDRIDTRGYAYEKSL